MEEVKEEDNVLADAARVASLLELKLEKTESKEQLNEIPQQSNTMLQQQKDNTQSSAQSSATVQKHEEGQINKKTISKMSVGPSRIRSLPRSRSEGGGRDLSTEIGTLQSLSDKTKENVPTMRTPRKQTRSMSMSRIPKRSTAFVPPVPALPGFGAIDVADKNSDNGKCSALDNSGTTTPSIPAIEIHGPPSPDIEIDRNIRRASVPPIVSQGNLHPYSRHASNNGNPAFSTQLRPKSSPPPKAPPAAPPAAPPLPHIGKPPHRVSNGNGIWSGIELSVSQERLLRDGMQKIAEEPVESRFGSAKNSRSKWMLMPRNSISNSTTASDDGASKNTSSRMPRGVSLSDEEVEAISAFVPCAGSHNENAKSLHGKNDCKENSEANMPNELRPTGSSAESSSSKVPVPKGRVAMMTSSPESSDTPPQTATTAPSNYMPLVSSSLADSDVVDNGLAVNATIERETLLEAREPTEPSIVMETVSAENPPMTTMVEAENELNPSHIVEQPVAPPPKRRSIWKRIKRAFILISLCENPFRRRPEPSPPGRVSRFIEHFDDEPTEVVSYGSQREERVV